MALAKEFGMAFFETSARTGQNVNETFFHIATLIKDKQSKNAASQKQKEIIEQSNMGGISVKDSKNRSGEGKKKKKGECCK